MGAATPFIPVMASALGGIMGGMGEGKGERAPSVMPGFEQFGPLMGAFLAAAGQEAMPFRNQLPELASLYDAGIAARERNRIALGLGGEGFPQGHRVVSFSSRLGRPGEVAA